MAMDRLATNQQGIPFLWCLYPNSKMGMSDTVLNFCFLFFAILKNFNLICLKSRFVFIFKDFKI